jgi:hypothetical protein
MVNEEEEIAKTTLSQLGGYGKLSSMINARNFAYGNGDLTFRFSGSDKADWVTIKLNGDDTYDMVFHKLGNSKYDIREVGKINDVYNDQLQDSFEEFTGLNISLSDRKPEKRTYLPVCAAGYEYVKAHTNTDGTYVRGFCRKIPEDRSQYFGFKSNHEMMDQVRKLKERGR